MITYKPRLVFSMKYIYRYLNISLYIKYIYRYLDIFLSINRHCRFMTSTAQLMIAALLFCVEIVAVASSILYGKYFIVWKIFTHNIVLVTCRRCRCCSTLATRGCSWCATRTGAAWSSPSHPCSPSWPSALTMPSLPGVQKIFFLHFCNDIFLSDIL